MTRRLETFLDSLTQASSLDDLQSSVVRLRDVYKVEHLVYHSVKSTGQQYAALTYDPSWVDHYVAEGFEKIDPVVQGCFQRFTPVDWKRLDWSHKSARTLLGDGITAGLGNQGFSIPIRGPAGQFALFTVNHKASDEQWASFTTEYMHELILAAHYMNERALAMEGSDEIKAGQSLSPRETDALTLLAAGMNRSQAAERLKISEHTLRVYIESARFKLGAANTTHAVANALLRGLICL